MAWPIDVTWYKLLTDWSSLIASVVGFASAIGAVLPAIYSERRKAKRELESLRRALGVEVRLYTSNAYRGHVQIKAVIAAHANARIPAIFVGDKSKLPQSKIYPNAVMKIGEFGDFAANIVLSLTVLMWRERPRTASNITHPQTTFPTIRLPGQLKA